MARHLVVLVCCCAALAACGDDARAPPAGPAPPTFVSVPGLPWARVSQAQVEEARRMGVPVGFENEWGMRFVYVPSGRFQMGSPEDEPGRGEDETQHEVRIRVGFYLQTEPVRWRQCPPGHLGEALDREGEFVTGVGPVLASDFAADLSQEDATWDYRLPTEAEWEYACRAGTASAYNWGDGVPADLEPYRTNAWGLKDMHAGLLEWCLDRYGPLPSWAVVDPHGPADGRGHVVRGALRTGPDAPARSARRRFSTFSRSRQDVGFRLAVPLGCGLGKYGSIPVTFRLVDTRDAEPPVAAAGTYDLRVIRMNDRLAGRTAGIDPVWDRVERPGSPVTLAMVPGKYYVYAESVRAGEVVRGIEIKFQVWEQAVEVPVPIPESDLGRYGSGVHEPK